MNNLHITCNNLEQRQNVFNVLDGMGYTIIIHNKNRENYGIQTDKGLKEAIQWVADFYLDETTQLTYTQFMEQYSMQALRNTIKNSGLSNPELSIKLGHSRKYLTNLLNKGCSTAMQNQLIEEINQVMAGTFKTDAEVIAELTQRLSDEQDAVIELQADFDEYLGKYDDCFTQLSQQKDENISLKNRNESIIAVLGPEIKELKSMLDKVDTANDELRSANEELAKKLKKASVNVKIIALLSLVCLATVILLIVINWGV